MGEGSDGNEEMIEVQLTKEELTEAYILMEQFIEGKFGFGELSSFDTTGGGTFSIERDKVLLTNSKGTDNLGDILGANVQDYLELVGIDVPRDYISMPDSTGPAGNDVSPINTDPTQGANTRNKYLDYFLNGIGKCKPAAKIGVAAGFLYLIGQSIFSGIGGDNNAHDAANMNNSIDDIVDEVKNMMNGDGGYAFIGSVAAAAPDAQEDIADVADQKGMADLVVKNAKIILDDGEYYMDITVANEGDATSPIHSVGIGAFGRSSGETYKELSPGETMEVRYNISTVCEIGPDTPIEHYIDALYAKADIWSKIQESNEDNNKWKFSEEDIPKPVNAASGNSQAEEYSNNGGAGADEKGKLPDLIVTNTRVEKINGEYRVCATIENTGTGPADDFSVSVEYMKSGRYQSVDGIGSGEKRDVVLYNPDVVKFNPDDPACKYKDLKVVIDHENEIPESNENNNVAAVSEPVDGVSGNPQAGEYSNPGGADEKGKGPDLTVMDTKLEEIDGEWVITATIGNTGDESVGNYDVHMDYYDKTGSMGRSIVDELAPGETRDVNFYPEQIKKELNLDELKRMGIHVVVDYKDEIKESNDENNRLRVPIPGEDAVDTVAPEKEKDVNVSEKYPQGGGDDKGQEVPYEQKPEKVPVEEELVIPDSVPEEELYDNATGGMKPLGYSLKGIGIAAAGIGAGVVALYGAYRAKKDLSGRKRDKKEEQLPGEEELPPDDTEQYAGTETAKYLSRVGGRIKDVVSGLGEKIHSIRKKDVEPSESEIGYNQDVSGNEDDQILPGDDISTRRIEENPRFSKYCEEFEEMNLGRVEEGEYGVLKYDSYMCKSHERPSNDSDVHDERDDVFILPYLELESRDKELLLKYLIEEEGSMYNFIII